MQNIITSSPLIWAGLLAGVVVLPILIHLINRLRHKRVPWAAMDFLLASYKKNRNWVWLKQLFLLLARIACLALLLLVIGQVGCQNDNLSRFLGGSVTHHYIVVDDSLSMSGTSGGESAMDHARQVIALIAARLAGRDNQRVTMLRYSQAWQLPGFVAETSPVGVDSELPGSLLDLNSVIVDRDTESLILDATERLQATDLAIDAGPALQVVAELVKRRDSEQALVYLVSDFRQAEWKDVGPAKASCDALSQSGAALEWIRCATDESQNLAITRLQPAGSVRVAGIPLMMEIEVTNFGSETARKIQVGLQSAHYPDETSEAVDPTSLVPEIQDLATLFVDEVPAGETVSRRFSVFFPRPGQHAVRASLPPDALLADNHDWVVTRFSTADKVLVIDGRDADDAKYLALALAPAGMTGLQVDLGDKALLRDAEAATLGQYESIFLLDIDQLEASAVQNLRDYLEDGGGVVFFTGPQANLRHYTTELYADAQGIFPVPLNKATSIPERLGESTADIVPRRHPIFEPVTDVDFSPLDLVQVSRICQPPPGWLESQDNSVNVLATVRGDTKQPLVVEKRIGEGTVLAVLTSAGTQWNNWLRNPTFPTTLLLMQDHVSQGRRPGHRQKVGTRKSVAVPKDQYRAEVEFVAPTESPDNPGLNRTAWQVTASSDVSRPQANVLLGQSLMETSQPGVYEVWRTTSVGEWELERLALHVDDIESRPALASRSDLSNASASARVVDWQDFAPGAGRNRGTFLVRLMLCLLLAGMALEQWLAYSASYHPPLAGRKPGAQSAGHGRRFQTSGKRVA